MNKINKEHSCTKYVISDEEVQQYRERLKRELEIWQKTLNIAKPNTDIDKREQAYIKKYFPDFDPSEYQKEAKTDEHQPRS